MTRVSPQVFSVHRFVLPLLCGGLLYAGCAAAEGPTEEVQSCPRITVAEAASLQKAIQNEVDTSPELLAFQQFLATNDAGIASFDDKAMFAKYVWTNGAWKFSEATTGVTSFVFNEGATLTVDAPGEEGGSLHLVTPDFTFTLSAVAPPSGYPTGEVKSASLGEWGVGQGVSAEYFGSRQKLLVRFPGGDWEETQDDQGETLSLTFSMPNNQAKIWKKKSGSVETLDISLNGVYRCPSEEAVLTAMFPDVWSLLKFD